jgi:hypothetical protein
MDHGDGHADSTMHDGVHFVVHGRANDEARPSPNALVGQTIGTTQVMIAYGRPSVRDRVIFGELVPYGEVWRTGANEATVVHFSGDVTVAGEGLPAGTYSLHTIPAEGGAWTVIFNRVYEQWGAYEYDAAQDALRVSVTPEAGPASEMMTFVFENVTDVSGDLVLYWDTVRLPVTIGVAAP